MPSRPCGGLLWIIVSMGVTVSSPPRATCEERLKLLNENLVLECPDKNDSCTWFHVVDNVEQRFLLTDNHGNANLMGNDLYSFGDFIVNTPNTSQCYEVCPAYIDSICDNCSNITINEMINPSEFELCIGDDINITLTAPPLFDTYSGASLKRGQEILSCSSKCCPVPESIVTNSAIYQCKNMDTTDSGSYYGHVLISCGSNHNVEWCTSNVTLIVRNCSSIDPTSTMSGPTSSAVLSSSTGISLSSESSSSSTSSSSSSQSSNMFLTMTTIPSPTAVSPSNGMNGSDDNEGDEVDKDDTNVGAIAGAVVGVVLVIIMIIILIIIGCLVWKWKPPKKAIECTEME